MAENLRRFYAAPAQFENGLIRLSADESKHLREVLRLRVGDAARVFDGCGREFLGLIKSAGGKREAAVLRIKEEVRPRAEESPAHLTMAVALTKGEKFDLVVQKTVELGVVGILPLLTAYAGVKLRDAKDVEKKLERWRRIALEAAKQCGRACLPEIHEPQNLARFLAESGAKTPVVFFSEHGGLPLSALAQKLEKPTKLTAVVGPEGGWSEPEIAAAQQAGFHVVSLGGRVLRAETAAIAAAALLQHLYGDI
jgi:16S rRNA (uracil1498-N3)-methyltransferase